MCQYYELIRSIGLIKENGFTLKKASSIRYPTETDADNTDDIALLASAPTQAESPLHNMKTALGGIGHHVNGDKTENMCFNQEDNITLNGGSLEIVDKFI